MENDLYIQSDVYYQSVFDSDKLTPYPVIVNREKKLCDFHAQRADELFTLGSAHKTMWKWRASLSENANRRMNKWKKLCS